MTEKKTYNEKSEISSHYFLNETNNIHGLYKIWYYSFVPDIHHYETQYKDGRPNGVQKAFKNNILKCLDSLKDVNNHGIHLRFNYNES